MQNRFADPGKCRLVPGNDGMLHILLEGDILFDEAKADIKPIHEKFLNDLAALMKVNTELKFLNLGPYKCTSLKGKQRFRNNWELSAARSIAVAEFLIKRGVNRTKLGHCWLC